MSGSGSRDGGVGASKSEYSEQSRLVELQVKELQVVEGLAATCDIYLFGFRSRCHQSLYAFACGAALLACLTS